MFIRKHGIPFVQITDDDAQFLNDLYDFCLIKEQEILQLPRTWDEDNDSPTSARYGAYNFFTFRHPLVKRVYELVRAACFEMSQQAEKELGSLWIQSWINLHRHGTNLGIHRHQGFWGHGYLSVNATGTTTVFEIDDEEDFVVNNIDGMLTLIGTDDVWHRVTPYTGDRVRVSIAFDLLGNESIEKVGERIFIPFV